MRAHAPCAAGQSLGTVGACRTPRATRRAQRGRLCVTSSAQTVVQAPVTAIGKASTQGTSRKQNEDRLALEISEAPSDGEPIVYAAVFDGHGGYGVSDWLQSKLYPIIQKCWDPRNPQEALDEAFRKADSKLLKPAGGFLGLGERGVGGSKCGSTAAVAVIFKGGDGKLKLATANVGDARVMLVRTGKALDLTEEHVPDNEKERKRIEAANPNPKMPLVRYVGGTWRVGGLLALSRAFGDAYLKSSMQFEGVPSGSDGYSSGFGVVAEPYTTLTDLTPEDEWVVLSSDGLFANPERGGGGGIDNDGVASRCMKIGKDANLSEVAYKMAEVAQQEGSTDDITVMLLRLGMPGSAKE